MALKKDSYLSTKYNAMKIPLIVFLLLSALMASGQGKSKPLPASHNINQDSLKQARRDSIQRSSNKPAQAPINTVDPGAKGFYLILPATDWAQLLQLLDQSTASHVTVTAFINYIKANAKEVPTIAVADSSHKK